MLLYRMTVYKNLVDCAKALVAAMRQFEVIPTTESNKALCDYLMEYQVDSDPHAMLDPQFGQAISKLWKDPCIPRVLEHQTEFYLMDSAP